MREDKDWSQKELARISGVDPTQLSRIESGYIKKINHDILIKLAKAFNISTDYILGLTTLSTRKSYDISELGLSEGAVKNMVLGKVDVQTLNRILEHEKFPALVRLVKIYFEDAHVAEVKGRNEIIDMAVMSLADFKKDAQGDINLMKSQKLGDHDAEIEKIKNNFLIILRDIKKSMASGEMPAESITADMMQKIWEQLKDKPREEITADDVADAIVLAVGKLDALGEKELEMVRQIAKQMLAGV